jgi:hypothetical protein
MDTMIRCEIVSTGGEVWLPFELAERYAQLGTVRMPAPKPDPRYLAPGRLALGQTWQGGAFVPGAPAMWSVDRFRGAGGI